MSKLSRVVFLTSIFILSILPLKVNAKKLLPEDYTTHVKGYFAEEQWEEGKRLLDEGIDKYPSASNLQWLMGRYWFVKKDYGKSRYFLIKSITLNNKNVEAKQLLVDVEDVTKNYSSAICYVNELLEVNPYWSGLWRRKIELYRKQGNEVEANRLLKRINQIYPNDSVLHNDYVYSVEVQYQKQKMSGDRKKAISSLEELLKTALTNEDYYLDIISLYLLEGDVDKALLWSSRGLAYIPKSNNLIIKKAGLLSELGRYSEAISVVQECMRRNNNSLEINRLYNNIILEAARASKKSDPYVLFEMAFQRGDRSKEVLDNLITLALQKGMSEDALYYIRESKRRYGSDKNILFKEYVLYCSVNDESKANNILSVLCEKYPNDSDLISTMCNRKMVLATRFIDKGQYAEGLSCATYVTKNSTDQEVEFAAWNKVLTCRIQMKRYDEAMATLDTISDKFDENIDDLTKRTFLLDRLGRTKEALSLYLEKIEESDTVARSYYILGYSEIAIPYIKRCMEIGATMEALNEAKQLLILDPGNDQALRYAINAAGQLGYKDLFRQYTEDGLKRYPQDPFYIVKKATIYDFERQYDKSVDLLLPVLRVYSGNLELTKAFSQSSEYRALELINVGQPNDAIAVIDTALVFDFQNKSLLYTKGLAYEKLRMYDKAYEFQKYYLSPNIEDRNFARQLKGLQRSMFKNQVGLLYLQSRYGETDAITSLATVEYTRKTFSNTYSGRINYVGRGGTSNDEIASGVKEIESGGVGIQIQAEWSHKFSSDWQTMINLAWSNRYFPILVSNVSVSKTFTNDWELELRGGYRRLDDQNLYSFGPGASKSWDAVWANAKLDFFLMDSKLYFNGVAQARFFPFNDRVSYISAMLGVGSAPELSVLDRALPGSFANINSMVGMGGQYMLTHNLSLGILGTWYTYYMEQLINNQDLVMRYKNMYNVYVQLYISF